jgi:predicted Rossmann fold flavoprotein
LGHTVLPKHPALAPVLADMKAYQPLQGVRLDVGATLYESSQNLAQTAGNLIFTQLGLNGPAVMDLSHHISARPGVKLVLSLNLLHFHRVEYDELLERKKDTATPLVVFLEAFFPPKVATFFIHQMGFPLDICMNDIKESELDRLTRMLKDLRFTVKGVKGFEFCQLSAGGVPVTEVHPETLESKIIQGLHLTGETLDVVGPCGGYNLQFAFSSGALAGRAAASSC